MENSESKIYIRSKMSPEEKMKTQVEVNKRYRRKKQEKTLYYNQKITI
jgi:hypothetical protein